MSLTKQELIDKLSTELKVYETIDWEAVPNIKLNENSPNWAYYLTQLKTLYPEPNERNRVLDMEIKKIKLKIEDLQSYKTLIKNYMNIDNQLYNHICQKTTFSSIMINLLNICLILSLSKVLL